MTTTAARDANCAKYPTRDSHHAHRVARLLAKSCAAQEIGPEACWLISVIAHQEDAKRYSGPVTFYNEQLMPLCGFGSKGSLTRARERCIEAGWLYYECGGKRKPGRYWTLIPGHANGLPDTPTDESETVSRSICRTEMDQEAGAKRAQSEPRSGRKVNQEADGKRTPFYPIPFPIPFPEEDSLSAGADEANPEPSEDEAASKPTEFFERYRELARSKGLKVPVALSDDRRAKIRKRLKNPGWLDLFEQAMAKLPIPPADGWQPDIDWLIENDSNAAKVVEGKYDWRAKQHGNANGRNHPQPSHVGPGQRWRGD